MGGATRLLLTDLDGTLLDGSRQIPPRVREVLHGLPERDVVRAVATGRSAHSARQVLRADDPIDYLIFSSGAGAVRWADGELLLQRSMDEDATRTAARYFLSERIDFMIHAAVPACHHAHYRVFSEDSPMWARIQRHREHASELGSEGERGWHRPATQLLAMPRSDDHAATHSRIREALPGYDVVRTTSPLDHRALWIEVFPRGVGKASAGAWLAEHLGVGHAATLAVGNDWNDLGLLEWAARACVVANAAPELCSRFHTVPSNDAGGLCEALAHAGWL